MTAYYNEFDPYAAEWLRNLIREGLIAPGDVDERSIVDVSPDDLRGYTQCHFFAGIGGWSLALRSAGWSDERPVWTGSCPCQPFSAAGKQRGEDDERHLWPVFFELIAEHRPPVVLGEQVASRLGRGWLAGVRADLEALGYAVGAADLCAACVGAPHIRQRLWWVADREQQGLEGHAGDVADGNEPGWLHTLPAGSAPARGGDRGMGISARERLEGCRPRSLGESQREQAQRGRTGNDGAWSNAVWISCADGKARRIEPGLEPLAHGVPNRVGRLRAYGNAIVPEVAKAFIRAYDGA